MADDTDLVSNVSIGGIDQTTADLKKLGDEGAAAFDKIGAAAKTASSDISSSTKDTTASLKDMSSAAVDQQVTNRIQSMAAGILSIKDAAENAVTSVASFGVKLASIGTAAGLGVVGVIKFADVVTKNFRNIGEVTKDRLRDQQELDKQGVESVRQSIAYDNSLSSLTDQLRAGKIGVADYGNAITALNKKTVEQANAQQRIADVEADARKKNDAALRAQQQTVALTALTKAYGGPLTQSLITLGATYEQLHKQVVDAFSPALSSLVDLITSAIDNNRGAITKFIDDASKALGDFVKNNGPEITGFFQAMISVASFFGQVITNVIIPAFNALKSGADFIAQKINAIFGTQFTGAALLAGAAVLAFSGAISAAISVASVIGTIIAFLVANFTPLGIALAIVIPLLIAWASTVNWAKLGTDIAAAFEVVVNFFTSLPGKIGGFFVALWDSSKALATDAAQWVQDKWQAVIDFFATLPDTVSQFFTDLWERIKSTAQDAFNQLSTIVQGWVTSALAFIQPLLDGIKKISDFFSSGQASGGGADGGSQSFAGGGHVRGPGTSSSDSIAAWLSDNEFVIRAKAVAKYGVGFLQLLNSGKLDLGKAMGFAAGGLVQSLQGNQAPRLAFATGGQVNARASRVLNLTIGNEQFNGLLMPEDVANKMTKFAVGRQNQSAGRKPGWVGGRK